MSSYAAGLSKKSLPPFCDKCGYCSANHDVPYELWSIVTTSLSGTVAFNTRRWIGSDATLEADRSTNPMRYSPGGTLSGIQKSAQNACAVWFGTWFCASGNADSYGRLTGINASGKYCLAAGT